MIFYVQENFWKIINFSLIVISVLSFFYFLWLSKKKAKDIKLDSTLIASVTRRFIAYFIDNVVCLNVGYVLMKILGYFGLMLNYHIFFLAMTIFVWLYFSLAESSIFKASIGKYAVGIQLINIDNTRLSFFKSTIRLLVVASLEFLMPLTNSIVFFTRYKQCAHDVLTNTIVIHRETGKPSRNG